MVCAGEGEDGDTLRQEVLKLGDFGEARRYVPGRMYATNVGYGNVVVDFVFVLPSIRLAMIEINSIQFNFFFSILLILFNLNIFVRFYSI